MERVRDKEGLVHEGTEDTGQWELEAQGGNLSAFEALYRRHVGRVYAICLRMSGNPAVAEELTQETFVRAWERIGLYEAGSHFGAWMAKVAVNVVLSDRRARQRRVQRESAVIEFPVGGARGAAGSQTGHGIDLDRAIARLPAGARRVFVLHDVEGYGHGEIGRMLDMAEGTSKAQLHRARSALRKVLES